MNEYIQEKISEFKNETYFSENALGGIELRDRVFKALENAYNRGVEDSLKQIPADRLTRELQTVGWNECKQQTIDNISKLLTNK